MILRGKHCRRPIAVMGVVDTFGHSHRQKKIKLKECMDNIFKHIVKMQEQMTMYPVKDGAVTDPPGTLCGRFPAKILI